MKLSATTLSSTSKTKAVVNEYPTTYTAADLTDWSTLSFPSTFKTIVTTYKETSYSVKAGLFGFDLTSFMPACKTAIACDY